MKKVIALLTVLMMSIGLIACSSVDTQPAIDSYNQLCDNYNKFADLANENIDEIEQEDVDFFNELAEEIEKYGTKLDDGTEFTQEEVDEMVDMFDELNGIIVETLEEWDE